MGLAGVIIEEIYVDRVMRAIFGILKADLS
jgi:hypothetical protein